MALFWAFHRVVPATTSDNVLLRSLYIFLFATKELLPSEPVSPRLPVLPEMVVAVFAQRLSTGCLAINFTEACYVIGLFALSIRELNLH
jgi:hypothetical protein